MFTVWKKQKGERRHEVYEIQNNRVASNATTKMFMANFMWKVFFCFLLKLILGKAGGETSSFSYEMRANLHQTGKTLNKTYRMMYVYRMNYQ